MRDGDRSEICRLKYLLWSIAILILKFVLNINFEKLQKIHKNFCEKNKKDIFEQILKEANIETSIYEVIFDFMIYEEQNFTKFYST